MRLTTQGVHPGSVVRPRLRVLKKHHKPGVQQPQASSGVTLGTPIGQIAS